MFSHNYPLCLLDCKKKTHNKIKQMTMVRTFQACETIMHSATVKGDEDILRITGAVNNNLVAAEARYDKACHANYQKQSALRGEARNIL